MADLLIELFSEEIPARMQRKAADDLKQMVTAHLKDAGLTFDSADAYATPRRLALNITGLPLTTPDVSEERRGPRADAPEKAIEGFLRGAGVARSDLVEREDKKGTFLYAIIQKKGQAAADVIADAVQATVRNFPWPKAQRWGDGTLKWVRPLHSILCVFDGAPINFDVDGIQAGNTTYGHRFMAPDAFEVTGFADYKKKLLDHKVILDPARRATLIHDTAQTLASAAGLELVEDKGLIVEVAGLVEWPVPMIGSFDADFLAVPEEVLILTMKKDQKYFVTRDPATSKLANKFIFTANIEPSDDGSAVTGGNERVLTARLSDAKFFYEQDLKRKLEDNLPALNDIVFHEKLGSLDLRVQRVSWLSAWLSPNIKGANAKAVSKAARLSKADLVSGMVYEFPEVQGVMGRYYAKAQGESDAVADAIRDHYAPLGPSDACPSAPVSVAVALAEKLDTLVGFFGIDQKPTGSKDPYALRRAALGVIRLIVENDVRVPLRKLIEEHCFEYRTTYTLDSMERNEDLESTDEGKVLILGDRRYLINRDLDYTVTDDCIIVSSGGEEILRIEQAKPWEYKRNKLFQKSDQIAHDLLTFFADRLKVQQRDKGVRHDLIDAVFAKGDDDLVRILNRVSALSAFLETDDGANLLAGYKRAANILKIEEKKDGVSYDHAVDVDGLVADAAVTLASALTAAQADAEAALESEDFEAAMAALSTLRAPIDAFFEHVKVNDDNPDVRKNRLALLASIRSAVNTVADFSLIEGQ